MVWPLFFGVATVVFLFLMQFMMSNLGHLVGKGLGFATIFKAIALSLPFMLILAVPMGFLFSMLMGFGSMSSHQEITVIKSSGVSLFRMMRPVLLMGLFLTGFLFWFNNNILPETNHQQKVLMSDLKRQKPTMIFEEGQFTSEIDGFSILTQRIDTATNKMYDITIYDYRRSMRRSIINADSGTIKLNDNMDQFIIDLDHGELHSFNLNDTSRYQKINFGNYKVYLTAYGFGNMRSSVESVSRGQREMNLTMMYGVVSKTDSLRAIAINRIDVELEKHLDLILTGKIKRETEVERQIRDKRRNISDSMRTSGAKRRTILADNLTGKTKLSAKPSSKIQSMDRRSREDLAAKRIKFLSSRISGDYSRVNQYDKTIREYKAEIHKKYAIPFACLMFVFVGCPLGIMSRKGNFGFAAGMSLVFYVIYWACLINGEDFADKGLVDPWLGMWMGDIVIGFLGLLLTIRVNYESFRVFVPNFLRKK
jgi:lipopolysaccharide export system permease protein